MRAFAIGLALVAATLAPAQPWRPESTGGLQFDDLFPRLPFFGQGGRQREWSHDDAYLSYLWNPYDTSGGADLWVFEAKSGKSTRVTSMELMQEFDPEAKKAIGRYATEKRDRDQRLGLDEKAYREAVITLRKESEERKKPLPAYPGISEVSWATKSHEVLITYRGDIYRWRVGAAKLTRLTKTREAESDVRWMPGDEFFTFRRGDGLYRMALDSAMIVQLDPKLPDGLPLLGYSLSPDGTKMMVFAGRSTGSYRQIEWISYRGRFPQVRRSNQYWGTSDEKIQEERAMYLFDLTRDQSDDNEPWEVWKWKSEGDEILDVSTHEEPWSADGKSFAFAAHSSKTREIEIKVARLGEKAVKTVYTSRFPGEVTSADLCRPQWMPDGNALVCLLESTGYRLPWLVDLVTGSARVLVQGNFEAYPTRLSPDGKSLLVITTALHAARPQVYRIRTDTGGFERVTTMDGAYSEVEVSHDASTVSARFASWTSPGESYVEKGGRPLPLTDSHRPGAFAKVNVLRPQLFSFKNRHGQDVIGYMFLPPGWKPEDKRPCMVYTYGGPLGQGNSVEDGDFNSSAYLLNMYLAQEMGFVTVTIDPRGSSGYGAAFTRASFENVGVPQTEDLVDAAKWLVATKGCDPARMALNGWSFGGWQTQHVMYTQPGVYTLGIAGAGPTEWQNYNQGYTQETIAVEPEGSVAVLDKFSLTKTAMNLNYPLMLLHGMEDDNVLFQHSIAVYRVLLQRGLGPFVEFVIDPTGNHGLGGDLNRRDTLACYIRFIQKHWGAQPWTVGTPDGRH